MPKKIISFLNELAWDESSIYAHWRNRPNDETPFFSIFNFGVSHESRMWNFKKDVFDGDQFPPDRGVKKWNSKYKNSHVPLLVPEDLEVDIPLSSSKRNWRKCHETDVHQYHQNG